MWRPPSSHLSLASTQSQASPLLSALLLPTADGATTTSVDRSTLVPHAVNPTLPGLTMDAAIPGLLDQSGLPEIPQMSAFPTTTSLDVLTHEPNVDCLGKTEPQQSVDTKQQPGPS
ncbi:unnamed protein product [Echinostoma caproni]|uniref:Secreted protein n=1 Tax=Echinostoma caproni TaxID=27848 RepID=A0A183ACK5_9TREM|nr:unnamed protein product [Echinostoma caproni]